MMKMKIVMTCRMLICQTRCLGPRTLREVQGSAGAMVMDLRVSQRLTALSNRKLARRAQRATISLFSKVASLAF